MAASCDRILAVGSTMLDIAVNLAVHAPSLCLARPLHVKLCAHANIRRAFRIRSCRGWRLGMRFSKPSSTHSRAERVKQTSWNQSIGAVPPSSIYRE
jgi:hypothetical protein